MRRLAPSLCLMRRMTLLGLLLVGLSAGGAGRVLGAQAPATPLYGSEEVQALILFNFIRFTEWPKDTLPEHGSFVVGVAGSRTLEDELIGLADKETVLKRRVRVVRVKTARDLAGCHVLYINPVSSPGEEPGPDLAELMPQVRSKPILTVSSDPAFLRQGGIVNIYKSESGTLRFEISPDNAKASGLVLSSRLLSLARAPTTNAKPKEPEAKPQEPEAKPKE